MRRPAALPIEPDVAVNKQVLDGRLYLMVLDDYHVAALRSQNVRNLARRFVMEKLGPDDQAAENPRAPEESDAQQRLKQAEAGFA